MTAQRWRQLKEVFQRLVEAEESDRESLIEHGCQGDEDLRREVEKLLRSHDRAGDFIEKPAVEQAAKSWTRSEAGGAKNLVGSDLVGSDLGPYRILRKIGQGGMGLVYLAERADDQYRQQVAIKLIQHGMASDTLVARFRQERQILASLDHPSIARLLDGGVADDGRPYLVMEHIQGVHIDHYCRDHGLSIRRRIKLFRRVCDAVQHAHRNLVIHRDLKPSNILVSKNGAPKLLDFGTAKLLEPMPKTAGAATVTGLRLMTPNYASPEQLLAERVTTASDVYALGVVLYELLTGQRPLELKSPFSPEGMRVVREQVPRKPSTVAAEAGERLASDLDNIVLMALRKEPRRRYASVEQLSEDLRRYLHSEPVLARRSTWRYRTGKFVSRNRAGVAAAMLVFLSLLAGLATTIWQAERARREQDRAERNLSRAEEVSHFLLKLFEVSDPYNSGQDSRNEVVERILDEGAGRIRRELKRQPILRASLMDTMGQAFLRSGNEDKSIQLLREAVQIKTNELGESDLDVAASLHLLGKALLRKGELDEAEEVLSRSLKIRRSQLGDEHQDVAQSLDDLARVLQLRGNLADAELLSRRGVRLLRASGASGSILAGSLNNLAAMLYAREQFDEAEALFVEAQEYRRQFHGPTHPEVAGGLNNLAAVALAKEDWPRAEDFLRQSLDMHRTIFGEENWRVAHGLEGLASLAQRRGNYQQAETLMQQALALRRQVQGEEHPQVVIAMGSLAALKSLRGETSAARLLYHRTLEIGRRALGPQHPQIEKYERYLAGLE